MSASHPGRSRPRHPFALALLLALPVAAWGCTVEHHPGNGSLGAELTSDDCTAGELFGGVDDSLADVYRVNLHVRTELTVTLESADFDAFVVVLDEADTRVAEDDDSHGNLNAALTVALEAGSYRIVANSATTAREVGAYVLSVSTVAIGPAPARLANISTRGATRSGGDIIIGGLIVAGDAPKRVLIRGIGPSLADFGVRGTLEDPLLTLFNGAAVADSNNACADHARYAEIPASLLPTDPREACIVASLDPGPHTAMLTGAAGGIGLIELFELDGAQRLVNLATRGPVGSGDEVLIGGLVITGEEPLTVVLRAIGPSLAAHGVEGVLENPHLTLYSGLTVIDANGDWGDHPNADSLPAQFVPLDPAEAAILVTLQPGAYTAIVSGEGGSTGIALVEVYER